MAWAPLLLALLVQCCRSFQPMTLKQRWTSLQSQVNVVSTSATPVRELIDELRNPSKRRKSIDLLVNQPAVSFLSLSPSDTKTLLCAIIAERDRDGHTLKQIASLLEKSGQLTSDLMYVAVRTAIRRKALEEAFCLLKEIDKRKAVLIDMESVGIVIELLCRNNMIHQAWDVLKTYHLRVWQQKGIKVIMSPEDDAFIAVIYTAGRLGLSKLMVDALCLFSTSKIKANLRRGTEERVSVVEADLSEFFRSPGSAALIASARRHNILPQEEVFITAMQHCAFNGDYAAAEEVFVVYEALYGIVETQAYSLLLVTYVSSLLDHSKAPPTSLPTLEQYEQQRQPPPVVGSPKLRQIIKYLVGSNLDSSPVISNLVLQCYCVEHDAQGAMAYLARIDSLGRAPNVAPLLSLTKTICDDRNPALAQELLLLMKKRGFVPSPALVHLGLLGDKASTASNVSQTAPPWAPAPIANATTAPARTAACSATFNGSVWTVESMLEALSSKPVSESVFSPGMFSEKIFGRPEQPVPTDSGPSPPTPQHLAAVNAVAQAAALKKRELEEREAEYVPLSKGGAGDVSLLCGCRSGRSYADCCASLHEGRKGLASPVGVMRARFTAIKYGLLDYIIDSTHPLHPQYSRYLETQVSPQAARSRWRRDLGGIEDHFDGIEFIGAIFRNDSSSDQAVVSLSSPTRGAEFASREQEASAQALREALEELSLSHDECEVLFRVSMDTRQATPALSSFLTKDQAQVLYVEERATFRRIHSQDLPLGLATEGPVQPVKKGGGGGFGAPKLNRGFGVGSSGKSSEGAVATGGGPGPGPRWLIARSLVRQLTPEELNMGATTNSLLLKSEAAAEVVEDEEHEKEEEEEEEEEENAQASSTLEETIRGVPMEAFRLLFSSCLEAGKWGDALSLFATLGEAWPLPIGGGRRGIRSSPAALAFVEDVVEELLSLMPYDELRPLISIGGGSGGKMVELRCGPQVIDVVADLPSSATLQLFPSVLQELAQSNATIPSLHALARALTKRRAALPTGQAHLYMEQQAKRGDDAMQVVETFNAFFPHVQEECPDAKAVRALVRALLLLVNNSRRAAQVGGKEEEKRFADACSLGLSYVRSIEPHIRELRRQSRSASAVYGTLSRLVKLASDGGDLDLAVRLFTLLPPLERRGFPTIMTAKLSAEAGRVDLCLRILPFASEERVGGGADVSCLPPEAVAFAVAALSRAGLWERALTLRPLLFATQCEARKAVPWGSSFLLYAAAQGGRSSVASEILAEAWRWNYTVSDLDFNLALASFFRTGLFDGLEIAASGVDKTASAAASASGETLAQLLQTMLYEGQSYSLHPVVLSALETVLSRGREWEGDDGLGPESLPCDPGPAPATALPLIEPLTSVEPMGGLLLRSESGADNPERRGFGGQLIEFRIPLSSRQQAARRLRAKLVFLLGSLRPSSSSGATYSPALPTASTSYVEPAASEREMGAGGDSSLDAQGPGGAGRGYSSAAETALLERSDLLSLLDVPISVRQRAEELLTALLPPPPPARPLGAATTQLDKGSTLLLKNFEWRHDSLEDPSFPKGGQAEVRFNLLRNVQKMERDRLLRPKKKRGEYQL